MKQPRTMMILLMLFTLCLGKQIIAQETTSPVIAFDFSAAAGKYATADGDWTVHIWDAENDQLLHTVPVPDLQPPGTSDIYSIKTIAFSPAGTMLAAALVGDAMGQIILIDTMLGEINRVIECPPIFTLDWSPDGKFLAGIYVYNPFVVHATSLLGLWDANSGKQLNEYLIGESSVLTFDWHPSQAQLVFMTVAQTVVWDMNRSETLYSLAENSLAAWSPTGDRLVAVGPSKTIRLCDGSTGELKRELGFLPQWTEAHLFWSSDGNWVGASDANEIRIWDTTTGELKFSTRLAEPVVGIVITPDGDMLYASASGVNRQALP